jgi:beta-lactamase class D
LLLKKGKKRATPLLVSAGVIIAARGPTALRPPAAELFDGVPFNRALGRTDPAAQPLPRTLRSIVPLALLFLVLLLPVIPLQAQVAKERSCAVVHELTADRPLTIRGDGCNMPLSPASTFKIPHALVALETGVVSVDSIETWDGRKYPRQVKWNHDHTVISALRPSVLWVFQRIAPRIGAERMAKWLTIFEYGNRDLSGPITEYWTNGRLQVSALEQVAFLRKFYRGALPVQPQHVAAVRHGLEQTRGTVENSLGVHPLAGDWQNARLNAKTGATTTERYRVSWLVGLLTSRGRDYVFASVVWRQKGDVDTLQGSRLAARTFIDLALVGPPQQLEPTPSPAPHSAAPRGTLADERGGSS